jgi:hypothetical protein
MNGRYNVREKKRKSASQQVGAFLRDMKTVCAKHQMIYAVVFVPVAGATVLPDGRVKLSDPHIAGHVTIKNWIESKVFPEGTPKVEVEVAGANRDQAAEGA